MFRPGSEEFMVQQLAQYMRVKYPDVPYHFDYGSGVRLRMGQAQRQRMLNSRGWPDLFVAACRQGKAGLFIEAKREGTKLWLRNGQLSGNEHVREQYTVLLALREQGYAAEFAVGFTEAAAIVDAYLNA